MRMGTAFSRADSCTAFMCHEGDDTYYTSNTSSHHQGCELSEQRRVVIPSDGSLQNDVERIEREVLFLCLSVKSIVILTSRCQEMSRSHMFIFGECAVGVPFIGVGRS